MFTPLCVLAENPKPNLNEPQNIKSKFYQEKVHHVVSGKVGGRMNKQNCIFFSAMLHRVSLEELTQATSSNWGIHTLLNP